MNILKDFALVVNTFTDYVDGNTSSEDDWEADSETIGARLLCPHPLYYDSGITANDTATAPITPIR